MAQHRNQRREENLKARVTGKQRRARPRASLSITRPKQGHLHQRRAHAFYGKRENVDIGVYTKFKTRATPKPERAPRCAGVPVLPPRCPPCSRPRSFTTLRPLGAERGRRAGGGFPGCRLDRRGQHPTDGPAPPGGSGGGTPGARRARPRSAGSGTADLRRAASAAP